MDGLNDSEELTDIDAVKASLTDKQRRFCEEYVVDLNGTQAAIRAGYSQDSAKEIAYENLTKPHVRKFVDHLKNNLSEATGITAVWIAQQYHKMATVGISDVYEGWFNKSKLEELPQNVKDCIKKIETRKVSLGSKGVEEQVKLEFYDKQIALKALRDMLGADAPKQTQLTGKDGENLDFSGAVIVVPAAAKPKSLDEEQDGEMPLDTSLSDL